MFIIFGRFDQSPISLFRQRRPLSRSAKHGDEATTDRPEPETPNLTPLFTIRNLQGLSFPLTGKSGSWRAPFER